VYIHIYTHTHTHTHTYLILPGYLISGLPALSNWFICRFELFSPSSEQSVKIYHPGWTV